MLVLTEMYCTDKSSDTSTIVLEEHLQSYCQCPQLEQQNPTRFSGNNRTDLVERFTDNMEWESSIKQTNRHSSGNRCISNRMGSSLSEQHSIRGMGQRNVSQTKQYQRTDGSIDVNHDIQKRIEQQNSSTSIKQHDNSSMHQQIDGYLTQDLHMITHAIFNLTQQHQITLIARHLSGTMNTLADFHSRIVDPYDWELSQTAFQALDQI